MIYFLDDMSAAFTHKNKLGNEISQLALSSNCCTCFNKNQKVSLMLSNETLPLDKSK